MVPDDLLTPDELAAELKVPLKTLYDWRSRNLGPQATRVGRHLRYRRSIVAAWLDAHTAHITAPGA